MSRIKIIPAIDTIKGRCVRLTKGDYDTEKVYSEDPLQVAKGFEELGITRLHLVDLEGAKSGHICNSEVLRRVASGTNLKIDFGGGVKSDEDIELAFQCGANQVTGGSIAVSNPELFEKWMEKYGSEKMILGADVRNEMVSISGWKEDSDYHLFKFLDNYQKKGVKTVICTDISKDGMLQGPAVELYQSVMKEFPNLELVASGGVSNIEDVRILNEIGCWGVIIGKAIYEKRIDMNELVNEFIL
ncbi:1-(5-phosphoribosyl)-5-[(5-phosphoribosylamino)methylideneamino]imidazole-4-carboxamide isomerase [Labilibaculum antarcticum]|uniref:1-(5-phosphoribosyl)-5-[(5-phosphoribosylamino)methylideneamino] imidazole-4-carboxamide isomerase n=1 Tax=Labilibaculum antarcticum TaxID=1717717 RepID=A0A1Y1CE56_9BACT|nr:1-(5-phosphoribosyl)-5-[(5-phosphoribosylamino)methylideneamino]imidazole-4-carboxamide isomerase [Labilibaculum antarcticum]BAX78600.1 1-(5-phosphoribosyl)-5-((5-phosphoribosylamino) methylideneamino)imidazole-4-carboxamide isomerase [Labilibaculum antarcticum]